MRMVTNYENSIRESRLEEIKGWRKAVALGLAGLGMMGAPMKAQARSPEFMRGAEAGAKVSQVVTDPEQAAKAAARRAGFSADSDFASGWVYGYDNSHGIDPHTGKPIPASQVDADIYPTVTQDMLRQTPTIPFPPSWHQAGTFQIQVQVTLKNGVVTDAKGYSGASDLVNPAAAFIQQNWQYAPTATGTYLQNLTFTMTDVQAHAQPGAGSDLDQADHQLNVVWQSMKHSTQAKLRAEQRAWIKKRDAEQDPKAKRQMTIDRTEYLNAIERAWEHGRMSD
jgi:lysozyme inhibitor LprI